MLTIKELKLKNIGRFVEEQSVNFDELGNLVQVDGENNNTGGSSGSGKSTFFNALDYLLGLNDLPSTVLQSRLTKEAISVTGTFDWDNKHVELTRAKGKLSVSVDGVIAEGSTKIVEEKITEMIGLPREIFRPLLHKRQKEGGFFLAMTPAKVNEFLTDVLNQGESQKKVDKSDKIAKELTVKKQAQEIVLSGLYSALRSTQDAILALGLAPIKDVTQASIIELNARTAKSSVELAKIEAEHKQQNEILDSQRPAILPPTQVPRPTLASEAFNRFTWDEAQFEKTKYEQEIANLLDIERDRQVGVKLQIQQNKIFIANENHKISDGTKAMDEAKRIAIEIKKIRDSICPTCEQGWTTDTARAKEAELLARIATLKTQINLGEITSSTLKAFNEQNVQLEKELAPCYHPQLPTLNEKIANYAEIILKEKAKFDEHQIKQNAENKALLDAWNAENNSVIAAFHAKSKAANDEFAWKQQVLRQQQSLEVSQIRGQAELDRRSFETAINRLKAYDEANTRYNNTLNTLRSQESHAIQKIDECKNILTDTEIQLGIAEETKRAIKSFMSCSFDEALEEIGDSATRIIRSIPNMANSTIQFQGIRETQSGKIKEEVNAVISMDGEEGIDIRSLSGGERSSADLAIDLAVIDLIENRSNKGINIFILDEPFTGLDTISIEMVLEVLKNAKINKKLIIVDHNPEVKQMVESRIVAVRDGLTSRITQ